MTEEEFRNATRRLLMDALSGGLQTEDIKMMAREEINWFDPPGHTDLMVTPESLDENLLFLY